MNTHITRRRGVLLITLCAAALAASACLPPPSVQRAGHITAPAWPETSDPFVLRVGSTYYMYGSNNHLRAPVTVTNDITTPRNLRDKNRITYEAMPTKPAWAANDKQLWAPTVAKFGNRWVMFFSTDRRNPPQPHNAQCIGRAFANTPTGPFTPEALPFHCGLRGGGALDPETFTGPDGSRWLYAAFGDTESPIHAMRLDANANLASTPVAVLRRQHPWEHHFLENPSMRYDRASGEYHLLYSAGRWNTAGYTTGVARCVTPTGPCTSNPSGPMIASASGRSGPGGASFFTDTNGNVKVIFATHRAGHESASHRAASIMDYTSNPHFTVK